MNKTFFTQKELAGHLGRPRQYVARLQALGLEFPATYNHVIGFLKRHPRPFRKKR
jgi:hypothetical protein